MARALQKKPIYYFCFVVSFLGYNFGKEYGYKVLYRTLSGSLELRGSTAASRQERDPPPNEVEKGAACR